jgi:Domain of unknown function (DUF4062)
VTEARGRWHLQRNPFPSYATASLDERPADAVAGGGAFDLPTADLPVIRELWKPYEIYLGEFTEGRINHGQVAFLHGVHGAGKTHAVLYSLERVQALLPAGDLAYRFYVKAADNNFIAFYRRLMGQLDLTALRNISLRFLGIITGEEAGKALGADEEARWLEQLREAPDRVYTLYEQLVVEPGAVLETQAAELAGIVGGREEFQRALTFLLDPALEEPAYAWLTGRDVTASEASRLGVSGPITDPQLCRYGIQLLVSMCTRIGKPVIVVIDQCERLVLDENAELHMPNVGLLHSLIEAVPRERGMLVLVGSDDAWRALPTDFRQRIGSNDVLAPILTPDQAVEVLTVYVAAVAGETAHDDSFPFTRDAILALLELSGGNIRRLLQAAWGVFQATSGEEITRAAVARAADQVTGSTSRDEAERAIERVLLEEGVTFVQPWRQGAMQADYGVLAGSEAHVLIRISQAVFYNDEAHIALGSLSLIRQLQREGLAARVVLIVLGYCSPEVLSQLKRAAHDVFVYEGEAVAEQLRGVVRQMPGQGQQSAAMNRDRLDEVYRALQLTAESRDQEVRALRAELTSLQDRLAEASVVQSGKIPAPRWRVFVSSESRGLDGFRDTARDVISSFRYLGLECFEPVMMEESGPRGGQSGQLAAAAVRGCDLLVGIAGDPGGSHPPDDLTPYAELEFQAAAEEGIPRLMFLLAPEVAARLEYDAPQGAHSGMDVITEEDFRQQLGLALRRWIDEGSFRRRLVDHKSEFSQARERLLDLRGATLIFGEPGTGKTKLIGALLADPLVQRSYPNPIGPRIVRLADGKHAIDQARASVLSIAHSTAAQPTENSGTAAAPRSRPVLITLFLDTGDIAEVDPETLSALLDLFSWDPLRAVVLAETNNHSVKNHLAYQLRWPAEAVVTVRDYDSVVDALEQMRRDAPGVPAWPQETGLLAEALGLRPMSLHDAATYIDTAAAGSARRAASLVRELLDAIANEQSPEGRYGALVRGHLGRLSPEARNLVALMTVLRPKPTLFPEEIALALDLSLDPAEAILLATEEAGHEYWPIDPDDDDGRAEHRDRAARLVAELAGRGLLERQSRLRPPGGPGSRPAAAPQELLTLHSTKRRIIQDELPLTADERAAGHMRAEAFYRARTGQAAGEVSDTRLELEDPAWWDDVEEWIYHLGQMDPAQATASYVTLFLDAFWWWDLYTPSDSQFSRRLLADASYPLIRAVPGMPQVARLLGRLRLIYPREHEATRARVLAELSDDPAREEALREITAQGAETVPIMQELSRNLGLTELGGLFTATVPMTTGKAEDPPGRALSAAGAPAPFDDRRHRLLGLICLILAEGYRYRAAQEPDGTALATAERCYRQAEAHLLAAESSWDLAWTHYLLGEVISVRDGDPQPLWDQATEEAEDDAELLANIERARADHLRYQNLERALTHYGRAVFYAVSLQLTSNEEASADRYSQAFYREILLHATKMMVAPLLDLQAPREGRLAEARRRLEIMLGSWGGSWTPDPDKLDRALRRASPEDLETAVDTIAAAAFPPAPADEVLGAPDADYYQRIRDFVEQARAGAS